MPGSFRKPAHMRRSRLSVFANKRDVRIFRDIYTRACVCVCAYMKIILMATPNNHPGYRLRRYTPLYARNVVCTMHIYIKPSVICLRTWIDWNGNACYAHAITADWNKRKPKREKKMKGRTRCKTRLFCNHSTPRGSVCLKTVRKTVRKHFPFTNVRFLHTK